MGIFQKFLHLFSASARNTHELVAQSLHWKEMGGKGSYIPSIHRCPYVERLIFASGFFVSRLLCICMSTDTSGVAEKHPNKGGGAPLEVPWFKPLCTCTFWAALAIFPALLLQVFARLLCVRRQLEQALCMRDDNLEAKGDSSSVCTLTSWHHLTGSEHRRQIELLLTEFIISLRHSNESSPGYIQETWPNT